MAINNGRITGPTAKRDRDKMFFIPNQWYRGPNEAFMYSENGEAKVRQYVIPSTEGELYVQRELGTQFATLLVSINIGGVLEWKPARSTANIIDSSTGRLWDPLAPFYNPLAS